jgi:isopenicillin-N N-acyltransferase like protein
MSIVKACQLVFLSLIGIGTMPHLTAEVVCQEGSATLSLIEGLRVLHVAGSAYERGYQHGKLLADDIKVNVTQFIKKEREENKERIAAFSQSLSRLLSYIPEEFIEEMHGVADGSGVAYQMILQLNLFPELFHCSGITATEEATRDGHLYHVRVLDYGVGKGLQKTAVLIVSEPNDRLASVSVSYAGFIGSVTGMNAEKISLGEMGGEGYGSWDGVPMAFLMKRVLENASSLEEAKEIFASSPRTCEYYYIIADGKTERSIGIYATAEQIRFIEPGSSYTLLNLKGECSKGLCAKFFLTDYQVSRTSHQVVVKSKEGVDLALFHRQPKHCVVLSSFTHPERYPILIQRISEAYGNIDELLLQEMIKSPVTRETNLHNAIFKPATLQFWVAHAGPSDEPASEQPYHLFSLADLLERSAVQESARIK